MRADELQDSALEGLGLLKFDSSPGQVFILAVSINLGI
jgi:hypothetical protein